MPASAPAISEARRAIVHYGRRLEADRLVVGSAGNISVRLGDTVIITPTGVGYDQIAESDICVLDALGNQVDGDGARSSELPMHLKIYQLTDAAAIVHTHSPYAAALSTVCDELPAIHYSILRLGGGTVRVAPYTTFGSDGLAEAAGAALAGRSAALLQNHGAIVYGASLDEAYQRALLVEWLAEVYWRARLIGTPRILSSAELDDVQEAARRHRYPSGGA
jgi:L-fuculose-phosphate aldolase